MVCIGSVIHHLGEHELWPIPKAEDYRLSPEQLKRDALSDCRFYSKELEPRHKRCIKKCMKELKLDGVWPDYGKLTLPEFHLNHLSAQRAKSGLPDPPKDVPES